jgi:hypothetical protein
MLGGTIQEGHDGASPVRWSDEAQEVISGDITADEAYITPAGGAVVTAVAPFGIAGCSRGMTGFATSLGFARKLEWIICDRTWRWPRCLSTGHLPVVCRKRCLDIYAHSS